MAVSTPPKAPEPFQITKRDLETVRYQNEPMRQASWTFPAVMLPGEDWPRVRQFALDTVMQMKQLYPEKFVGKTQQDWENALTGFIATRRPDFRAQVLGQLKSRYGEGKPMDPDLVLTKAIEGFGKQASGLTLKKLVEESKKDPWYGLGTAEKSKEVFPLHHEGRLVGYLRTGKSLMGDKTTGFIYVTPSERNKGIGTKAMLDVAQRYPGLLSFVHEKNLPSLRIHEKAGYEFTQKRGRGSPETMIWKHLEKKAEEQACFRRAAALALKDPGLRLMKGPPIAKGDSAHFWAQDEKGRVIDPTAHKYPGVNYKYAGAPVNLTKNLDFLMALEKKAEKTGFFHSAPPDDPIRAWLDKVKNEAKSQGYNLFAVAEYKKGPGASITLAHGSGGDSAVKNARNAQEQWERQKDAGLLKKGASDIFMDEIAKISGGVVAKGQEAGTVPAMGTDRKFNMSRRLGFMPPMPRRMA